MSVSSWLTFNLRSKGASIDAVLGALSNCGWTTHREGHVVVLPLGDNDDFNWTSCAMSSAELAELIQKKCEAGEVIGIVLMWKDSDVGGNFHIDSNSSLKVALSINRVLLSESLPYSNVSWYLERILPALQSIGGTQTIEWSEYL